MNSYNNNFDGDIHGDFVNGHKYVKYIGRKAPAKDHPNARECPQCWEATWKGTKKCVQCGYDIFAYDHRLSEKRRLAAEQKKKQDDDFYNLCLIGALAIFAIAIYGLNNLIEHSIWWINALPFFVGIGIFILVLKWNQQ